MIVFLNYVSIFIMVFSILFLLKTGVNFVSALLSNPPQRLILNSRQQLYLGLFASYFITFLLIYFI